MNAGSDIPDPYARQAGALAPDTSKEISHYVPRRATGGCLGHGLKAVALAQAGRSGSQEATPEIQAANSISLSPM